MDELSDRIERLESVAIAAISLGAAAFLALGLLLPYITFRQDEADVTVSALTFAFRALSYRQSDGDVDGPTLAFGIAFGGLVVVVLIALAVLTMIGGRRGDRRTTWLVNAVAVLLVIGVLGVWVTALLSSKNSHFALHQGPVWLSAGAALFAILAGSTPLRGRWLREHSAASVG